MAVSGVEVTVSDITVSSATRLTATFTIAGGATISDRTVTVTTPEGTSNGVTFTVRGASSGPPPSGSQTFSFTGAQQNFTVPAGVTSITIEAFGAEGGDGSGDGIVGGEGGDGGSVTATVSVTPGESLAIFVGGQGATVTAGFNGGGAGGDGPGPTDSGGGGGADGAFPNGGGGGGGGSSFTIGTATGVTHQQGVRTGNGQVTLTW